MPYKDKEQNRQYQARYRAEHKDKIRELQREWCQNHKDRLREYNKKYREEHRDYLDERRRMYARAHPELVAGRGRLSKQRARAKYNELKLQFGCMNPACGWQGEFAACQLDFHHIDPATKVKAVSQMVKHKQQMKDEIRKCTCICSNCHRLVTWGELDEKALPLCELSDDRS